MPQLVGLEVSEPAEPHLADVALVRFLSRVHQVVPRPCGRIRETLGAKVAFKRTFPCMRPQMVLEGVKPAELFSAKAALMRLLSCVTQQMDLEVIQLLAGLGAKVALVN